MVVDRLQPLRAALKTCGADSDAAPIGDVQAIVEQLLVDESTEIAAAVGAELERAALRLERSSTEASSFSVLRQYVSEVLGRRIGRDTRAEGREFDETLRVRILDALRDQNRSPSELAQLLQVDLTQISRAGRLLASSEEIAIDTDQNDKRRRLYRSSQFASQPIFDANAIGPLNGITSHDVFSDLLPGRFGDALTPHHFRDVLDAAQSDLAAGRYEPTPMHRVAIPKPSGGERPAAALRFLDRLVYGALSKRCGPQIEAALGAADQVLWPRGQTAVTRWVELESFVSGREEPYILSVDISSFYDSIRHDVLVDQLRSAGCEGHVVTALGKFLGAVTCRKRGLPQGLAASDRLASIVLAPLDADLKAASVPFVRHGDDVRIAARSLEEARSIESLVRSTLQTLDLFTNDDKTRTLRHDTYMQRRSDVAGAVKEYLDARDLTSRNSSIHGVLSALGADEELQWGWYHGNLRVTDVLSELGSKLEPGDEQALIILLNEVASDEAGHQKWHSTVRTERSHAFLVQAGVSLLAASGATGGAAQLEPWLVARPEYADALSMYVESVAPKDPIGIAGMLQRIESSHVSYDAQWLRLYNALGTAGQGGEFDPLARGHLGGVGKDWTLRLRAGRFLAERGESIDIDFNETPLALRDDVLSLVQSSARSSLPEFLDNETATARALLAA